MNNKIFELSKGGVIPFETPNMTSASVGGFGGTYSAVASYGLFNKNSVISNGHSNSTIMLPFETRVISINFGNELTATNYIAKSTTFKFYLDGNLVNTIVIDGTKYIGKSYQLNEPILCDSVYRNVGFGSVWQAGAPSDVDASTFNKSNGCTLSAILLG